MKHIRIVSPSGAIDSTLIDGARCRLEAWGYEVSVAPHAKGAYGCFSGTPEERLADLNEAFSDPQVDIILCSRGGYGLCQIVDGIEVKAPKLVVGFSDITCLHNLMGTKGIPSLHSIMCKHISQLDEDSEPLQAFRKMLAGEGITYAVPAHPLNRGGKTCGVLRGGNMSVFHGLRNTPFDLVDDGNSILFIEDVSEPAHALDRIMHSLRLSGYLSRLKGLVVGQFAECREDPRLQATIYECIWNTVKDYDFPVVFDFQAGHVDHNLPLLLNAPCTLEADLEQCSLTFENNAF